MTHDSKELLADQNRVDAEAFCREALGPFVADTSQYAVIIAELMQLATDRALAAPQPGMRAEGEATAAASLLRGWAKAYRDTPEHRFPSDPNAEFFPVDLERAADLLAAPVPPPEGAAITTERLDKLQFGRVLHDRPAPDDVRSALADEIEDRNPQPPDDEHISEIYVTAKTRALIVAALRSAPVSALASLIESLARLQRRLMSYCNRANAGHMPSDAREFARRIQLGFLAAYEEAGVSPPAIEPETHAEYMALLRAPAVGGVREALGKAFWVSRGGPPENFDNHFSGKFIFDYPPFVACMKDADVALAALRSAPVSLEIPHVRRIEMVQSPRGYEIEADPVWRLELDGICADFHSEVGANNFRNAILRLCSAPVSAAVVGMTLEQIARVVCCPDGCILADTEKGCIALVGSARRKRRLCEHGYRS